MPRRELKHPHQVEDWLVEFGLALASPGRMILIGSGALLWHAAQQGITTPLPENSMDIDPITDSEEVARRCYEALIGSEFELKHGWHVNLMPDLVLREFPTDWRSRASLKSYSLLSVEVPSPADLLVPKRKRNEPRDQGTRRGQSKSACELEIMPDAGYHHRDAAIWGEYVNYDDVARFEYGRLLWRQPEMRARLLRHWLDERHPGHERFLAHRTEVEQILFSHQPPAELQDLCRRRGTSLRCMVREIPPVFGQFF